MHMHDLKEPAADDMSWAEIWENSEPRTEDDEEDEGGDAGLSKSADRTQLSMRRSFELLLNTGHVIRFEVFFQKNSPRIGAEMIRIIVSRLTHAGW
jgi:hypothetical protein